MTAAGGSDRKCHGSDQENQTMADNVRMALTEPERKRGQRGGPLRSQLVPAAAKGPRHPQGRSEPASGAGRAAALTGNGAVGASRTESGPRADGLGERWLGRWEGPTMCVRGRLAQLVR